MQLEIGKLYKDRQGKVWHIISTNNGQRSPFIYDAARWEGKIFYTRTFTANGSFFHDKEDKWDLIEEVKDDWIQTFS